MSKENNIDLEKLEILFVELYVILTNVANRIVHDENAAEDIVQDVFFKIWLKKKDLIIHTSLKSYLFKATTNTAYNYYSKHKRIIPTDDDVIQRHSTTTINDAPHDIRYKELKGKIKHALSKLPSKCRTVFILSRYQEMKYAEISEYMSISIKTVENQMGKALKRLRVGLKETTKKKWEHI